MVNRILNRKLVRDLIRLRGQIFTVALVIAAGLGGMVGAFSGYASLKRSSDQYYVDARLADVFVELKRAPDAIARQLAQIPGVGAVQTNTVYDATLTIGDSADPIVGRFIGVSAARANTLNLIHVRRGRLPRASGAHEALISEAFAKARHLRAGDSVDALINGKRVRYWIVGIGLSPEYIYASRGGFSDDKSFGVFWVDETELQALVDMDGAFNHASLRLASATHTFPVRDAVDRVLSRYGGSGSYTRAEQHSFRIVKQEVGELRVFGSVMPAIFLAVSAFLVNVVLSRLLSTQRGQIATLKALGYRDSAIGWHFGQLVLVITGLGILMGALLGTWLGHTITRMYANFFHLPHFDYRVDLSVLFWSALASVFAAGMGAWQAIRSVTRLSPAQAMQPIAPAVYRRALVERLGLRIRLGPVLNMMLRSIERRPLRAALTVIGISGSIGIVISGASWQDAVDYMLDQQFQLADRGNVSVAFGKALPELVTHELARLPGVRGAEVARAVPVRLVAGHREYLTSLMGVGPTGSLRQIIDRNSKPIQVVPEGVMLTDRLAERLQVAVGDVLTVKTLEGERREETLIVSGLANEWIGMNAYATNAVVQRLMNEGPLFSQASLRIEPQHKSELYKALKQRPFVATVVNKDDVVQTFRSTSARNLLFFTTILAVFAGMIAFGVVYNSVRIALSERAWELASLRVLGFTRQEVAGILLGELGLLTLVAMPLGWLFGYGLIHLITEMIHGEAYAIPVVVRAKTYVFSTAIVMGAALASAYLVRRRIDHLDLVAVLKTRE